MNDDFQSLPYSKDDEQAVLSLMLEHPAEVVPRTLGLAGLFYMAKHRILFDAIVALYDEGKLFTLVDLSQHLIRIGEMEKVGGPQEVAELMSFQREHDSLLDLLSHHIEKVKATAQLRELILTCSRFSKKALSSPFSNVSDLLDEAEEAIFALREAEETTGGDPVPWKKPIQEAISGIQERYENDGESLGLSTGFNGLDELTSGYVPGEYWVIAARPSMGKTSFAMQSGRHCAEKANVLAFSAEMKRETLALRSLSHRAKIENRRLSQGRLSKSEFPRLMQSAAQEASLNLFVDDTPNIDIKDIRSKARRFARERDINIIIVDYLQLVSNSGRHRSREEQVAQISTGLKALSKELNCTVIVLAQLNRDVEKRPNGRPRSSDLRESGGIEQDADVVLLLARRPSQDGEVPDDSKDETIVDGIGIVDKCRNGATGDIGLTFYKSQTRFTEVKLEDAAA